MNPEVESSVLFEDLIAQPLAVSLLEAALSKGRYAPAYLFSGPDGVGRSLAALRFLEGVLTGGKSLMRERRRLEAFNHPDLLWVEPTYQHQGRLVPQSQAEDEGVSRRSPPLVRLEQIRGVTRFLGRQPVEALRGMVVIEAAEAMPEAAANALLKTLEEPGHGLLILLSAAPERLLATIRSRCQQIFFSRLDGEAMEAVLARARDAEGGSPLLGLDQPELLAMAAGSPGALLNHLSAWQAVPEEFWSRLQDRPQQPMVALALARDITEALNGEQQLWLIDWWQQHLWIQQSDPTPLKRLERLRSHLLGFVQPRLAWEVALLELMPSA
ncbi:MAG: DNA polymerase III subunit delta' [Prochlorococcaceae cyanobacterium ETNP14_MAG_4]|nr:DNA polymerase III subunit delta' [Prochlorococcaceae cyanobacterium ETNP14_MAG_4]